MGRLDMRIADVEELCLEANKLYYRINNQISLTKKLLHPLEAIYPVNPLWGRYVTLCKVLSDLKKQRKQAARLRTAARRALEAEKKKAPEKTLDVWGDLI
jgi:hypothetical protein